MDTAARDDVREADGLIFLDGLAESATALPPAMFPLIKDALTSANATAAEQRWLLAAGDRARPATAGLAGLFRAIGSEYPDCLARYVEFDRVAPADEITARLLQELLAGAQEPTVIYAGNTRYRRELVPAELSIDADDGAASGGPGSAEARAIGLTSDSVIVLVGGARGITSRLARELAAASHCRIELVGRTQPPDEPLPDDTEAAPDAVALRAALARRGMRSPAEIERATRDILALREVEATLAELHELGAAARYHCADAQDAEAIHQVLKTVHEEYGRVDGLVYAAGVIEDQLIADKDPESFARVFDTKVGGARLVLDTLEELHCAPGFAVLFGSTAAVFGSRGQADYAAANDALEAIGTAWAARAGRRCLTVHWGPWAPPAAPRHGHPRAQPGVRPARHRPDRPAAGRAEPAARAGLGRSGLRRSSTRGWRPMPASGTTSGGTVRRMAEPVAIVGMDVLFPGAGSLEPTGATWSAASMPSPTCRRTGGSRSSTTRSGATSRTECTAGAAGSWTTSPTSIRCRTASCRRRFPRRSRNSSSRCGWRPRPSRTRAAWTGCPTATGSA